MIHQTFLSDLHFGHPRLDVGKLYSNLEQYFYPELAKTQILFFTGDLTHAILPLFNNVTHFFIMFLTDVLLLAKKYKFKIRAIKGTYTHEREQLNLLNTLNVYGVDCKIISDVEVEHITNWNNGSKEELTVGYIPDSIPYRNSNHVLEKVKDLCKCVGLNSLDLIIGHGTFRHTLPEGIRLPNITYEINQFKNLVSGYIVMGHIHTPSKNKNVIYVGSFDRTAHGEEEHKGFLSCTKDKDKWIFKFIPNNTTTPFITVTPTGNNKEEIIADFVKQVESKFPIKNGNVRFIYSDPEIKVILSKICATRYPQIRVTAKNSNKIVSNLKFDDFKLMCTDSEVIDVNNLGELISSLLSIDEEYSKFNFTKEDITSAIGELGVKDLCQDFSQK